MFAEYLCVATLVTVITIVTATFLGICNYAKTFNDDWILEWNTINNKFSDETSNFRESAAEIKLKFINIINFHNEILK